jgi:hypothetical protein
MAVAPVFTGSGKLIVPENRRFVEVVIVISLGSVLGAVALVRRS